MPITELKMMMCHIDMLFAWSRRGWLIDSDIGSMSISWQSYCLHGWGGGGGVRCQPLVSLSLGTCPT